MPVWVLKLWRSKSTYQVFFFQLYFNKKYIEVAINDFSVYRIISKWLRIKQNADRREKQWDKKVEAKEEIVFI